MINFIQRAVTSTLVLIAISFKELNKFKFTHRAVIYTLTLLIAPLLTTTTINAGTLGGSTSYSGGWGWSFSYENMQFTRANITVEHEDELGNPITTIIAAPTFDITEGLNCIPKPDETVTCKGSALFKGVLKVKHGPAPDLGEAWVDVQMKWPEVDIEISSEQVLVPRTDAEGNDTSYHFLKESRIYKVLLQNPDSAPQPGTYTDKLTDGFKRVVPELPRSGVYLDCDGSPESLSNFLCKQEIGYGMEPFDPNEIFSKTTAASGLPVSADTGFYWDEVCLAFDPEHLNVDVEGQDYNLKEDVDGRFRSCEGRSVVFNACTDPGLVDVNGNLTGFDCTDTNEGHYFTLILSDAAAGDRLEAAPPLPTTACIGTDVADWLALSVYSKEDPELREDLVIFPCDPNQGYVLLPIEFSDSSLGFTSSEGGGLTIDNLQIISLSTFGNQETAFFIEEFADKTEVVWDFSNILLENVLYIASLELGDTITGSALNDVILTGNGSDHAYGFSGDDCIDGQQNNDHLWGDGHASNDPAVGGTVGTVEVSNGSDAFVLTSKLGKDTIYDYRYDHVDPDGERDVLMNISSTSTQSVRENIVDNEDGTYTVFLKGQNSVIVHTDDGKPIVVDGLSGVCRNHPYSN